MSARRALVAAATVLLLAVTVGAAPAPGADAARCDGPQQCLERTVRFLQEVQNPDGGFGGVRGGASDVGMSGWAAWALAAFAINPRDQARPGGTDVYTYLVRHADELRQTTDFQRTLLVAVAAGTDPRDFGGRDLIAATLERRRGDGSFAQAPGGSSYVNATIWGAIALSAVPFPDQDAVLRDAARWIVGQQIRGDGADAGGWPAFRPGDEQANLDMTGGALQALAVAGHRGDPAVARALAFLRDRQRPDGGWGETVTDGESNVASTAWVLQGLVAAGEDPRAWAAASGRTPYDYLAGQVQADGAVRWKASTDLNPVWMTAQVAPALAGRAYPLPAVPFAGLVPQPADGGGAPAASDAGVGAGTGQGGTGATAGDGVIAGGGGGGAPLFSRPQAQSQGRTPGGTRQVDRRRASDDRRSARPAATAAPAAAPPAAGSSAAPPSAAPPAAAPAGTTLPAGAPSTPSSAPSDGGGGGAVGAPVAVPTAAPGGGSGPVTGRLIADGQAGGDASPAAPGLLGSQAGDPGSAVPALALAALALLLAAGGWRHERRLPREHAIDPRSAARSQPREMEASA